MQSKIFNERGKIGQKVKKNWCKVRKKKKTKKKNLQTQKDGVRRIQYE
jgi:hypothetical protein